MDARHCAAGGRLLASTSNMVADCCSSCRLRNLCIVLIGQHSIGVTLACIRKHTHTKLIAMMSHEVHLYCFSLSVRLFLPWLKTTALTWCCWQWWWWWWSTTSRRIHSRANSVYTATRSRCNCYVHARNQNSLVWRNREAHMCGRQFRTSFRTTSRQEYNR